MNFNKITTLLLAVLLVIPSFGQNQSQSLKGSKRGALPQYKYYISSTYLSLTNFGPQSVDMYELHFGYRITPKDIIAIKAATWSLFEPMGIPWGPDKMNETELYPGRVREFGVGVSYQRMLWKGLFASAQLMPLKKNFLAEDNKKVDTGFRLYTSAHLGYHIPIFKNRIFVEPQIHCNYWPIDSKGPQDFAEVENKWNNYFLWEPNLFIGVKF